MARAITRRRFVAATLKSATLSAAALFLGANLLRTRAAIAANPALRFFTPGEAATIAAACARIVPSSPTEPGATEVGAVGVIDFICANTPPIQALYRGGAAGLDETARALHRQAFAKLAPSQQDAILISVQTGKAPGATWKQLPSPLFFLALGLHTKSAYYTNPLSFKHTGYPGIYDTAHKRHH